MSYTALYAISTHGMHIEKAKIDRVAQLMAYSGQTPSSTETLEAMRTLMDASHAYEANLKIMQMAHTLYTQALRIGEMR